MAVYLKPTETVLQELDTNKAGLTREEAARRLVENGGNELAKAKKKGIPRRFLEQLINPMVLVLIAAAAVSVVLAALEGGNLHEYAEAGIILVVVLLNSILGVFQENKAEKAIEALQEMSAATAKVRRGGDVARIPARELVVGDIVLLEAGDAVPADIRLLQCASLQIEEAALTGESVPVGKITSALRGDDSGAASDGDSGGDSGGVTLGDRRNMAYMGSDVTYGRGEGVVAAVGMDTEMGKIAGIIQSTAEGETPLQRRLSQLSKILSILVLGICAVIFVVQLIRAGEISTDVIMPSFMLAVSLAVAAIPEGLAAVITIVLSIGVTNMAKRNAIIRRLPAVETLGCTQIICSDKTGTLTQNKMTVVESYGDEKLVAKAMALCCDSQLSQDGEIMGDPTENALVAHALANGLDKNALADQFPRVAEAPFDSARKLMSTIHKTPRGFVQFTKGAPEEVLRVCSHALVEGNTGDTGGAAPVPMVPMAPMVPMSIGILEKIDAQNMDYANRALRVLACAYKEYDTLPVSCGPADIESGMTFVGLTAMIDPVRPEAKAAVDSCNSSGIKVVMITGDHKDTAIAIARDLGIITSMDQAITGRELEKLSDDEFEDRIENIFVYARVQPDHKVRIVNMWKHKGYITAMTGDGVNDAPAIKSGDIGVGMGITGTDVTKNVADMVLSDDNFATIVAAVEEGRRIYENIKKTIQFLLSSNASEVLSIFIAILMGFELFLPIHLLYINLITDSIPAIALGMDPAESGIMEQPPRGRKEGIFSDGLGFDTLYQGVLITILTLAAYFIVDIWEGHTAAMTAAFYTMSMSEVFHAVNLRSRKQNIFTLKTTNKLMWGAIGLSLVLTLTVIYVPALADVFSLQALTLADLALTTGLSLTIIPMVEAVKAILRWVRRLR
ncbi:MAG: cation-translocating P-type ATPase [Oscillospiraceae bacterium]|nr:cation-translocating P-type ATPase [Oscillospiraceae bacterium]